jgi:hypothetical protein
LHIISNTPSTVKSGVYPLSANLGPDFRFVQVGGAATFAVVRRGSRDSLYLGNASAEAKETRNPIHKSAQIHTYLFVKICADL